VLVHASDQFAAGSAGVGAPLWRARPVLVGRHADDATSRALRCVWLAIRAGGTRPLVTELTGPPQTRQQR